MQFSEEKKAPLDRVGRKVKKKKNFFFLGSGPEIGSVGTWETDNQLDVPLDKLLPHDMIRCFRNYPQDYMHRRRLDR